MKETWDAEALTRLALMSPADRGRRFPQWVARAFEEAGYRVRESAGAARPRDTDILASREHDYLVECKWTKRPADVDALDSLRARLRRTSGHVIGVFVSMSGFTQGAVDLVDAERDRLILMIDGAEVDRWIARGAVSVLLRRKRQSLVTDGRTLFAGDASLWAIGVAAKPETWALPDTSLGDGVGLTDWVQTEDGFDRVVFVEQIPDVDWTIAPGSGVGLDLDLPIETCDELWTALELLARAGWITRHGRFSINQSAATWHGWGAASFGAAVASQGARYKDLSRIHHTEQATYVDHCRGGFYSLAVDIRAHGERIDYAHLSARLPGVPVDAPSDRLLVQAFDVEDQAVYRPLARREDTTQRNYRIEKIAIEPLRYTVEHSRWRVDEERWVNGLVAENPLLGRRDPLLDGVSHLSRLQTLVCHLSDWLPAGEQPTWVLGRVESAWTADAEVLAIRAELTGTVAHPAEAR